MPIDNDVKVIVHRGTHQIGGCCTEIATATTRILIDFGANLDEADDSALEVKGITDDQQVCDGIIISHYHGDHIGELGSNCQSVPVYMTEKAIKMQEVLQAYTKGKYMYKVDFSSMKAIHPEQAFTIGDIKILPIESEHSAFEPLMFYIEAQGRRILHTGDFRMHGLHWSKVQQKLKQLPKLDLIITEGTTLSRAEGTGWSEATVQEKLQEILRKYKYCFFLSSSSNLSRIETFAQSIPRGKYFLMDDLQRKLLEITESKAFEKALTCGDNLKLEKQGFGMIVRAKKSFAQIMKKFLSQYPEDTCLIYSMWSGYLEKGSIKEIYDLPFRHKHIVHSSGHVVLEDLNSLLNDLNPKRIVVIHTESSVFAIDLKNRVVPLKDKEMLSL